MVIGLFTSFSGAPDVGSRVDITQADPVESWTTRPRMRRYGAVYVLRRHHNKLQVVMHDPWHRSNYVKEQYCQGAKLALFGYRKEVRERLESWARDHGTVVESKWWGGALFREPGQEDDAVAVCLEFIRQLVTAEGVLPDVEDEDGFKMRGYVSV